MQHVIRKYTKFTFSVAAFHIGTTKCKLANWPWWYRINLLSKLFQYSIIVGTPTHDQQHHYSHHRHSCCQRMIWRFCRLAMTNAPTESKEWAHWAFQAVQREQCSLHCATQCILRKCTSDDSA